MKNKILAFLGVCFIIFLFATNQYPDFKNDDTNNGDNIKAEQQEYNSTETNVCQSCGNRFIGRGYTEVAHGVWRETQEPYQSFICSKSCGSSHTKKWENTLGKKRDGKVYDKEPCGLCEGTGIEKNHSSMSDEYGRKCPMCNGKGFQNY